jgi:hypothetical protein
MGADPVGLCVRFIGPHIFGENPSGLAGILAGLLNFSEDLVAVEHEVESVELASHLSYGRMVQPHVEDLCEVEGIDLGDYDKLSWFGLEWVGLQRDHQA